MFSDTKFWRLVWKEYRTQLPLWLALLIATPVLQVAMLGFIWLNDGALSFRGLSTGTANTLMAIGFIASIVYLLGCCATMFSVEHETGVFDFQRVLPTNQPRVFWAKASFAAASSLFLSTLLWTLTRGLIFVITVFVFDQWETPFASTWFGTYGLLYMAEVFAWSILASLVVRQPLWSVIVAIALQSLMMQVVLPYLANGRLNDDVQLLNEDLRFVLSRFVVLALLVTVDVVLGKLWYEDRLRLPRWRIGLRRDSVASYPADAELPPYIGQRQIGWSRLLWLSWRDGRWVMIGVLAWYGYHFFTLKDVREWEFLMLPSFIGSFIFGVFAFAPEQWGGRFRYLTERGCSPRHAWLSRQVLWIPPLLLMCAGTLWKRYLEDVAYPHSPSHAAFDVMMAGAMTLIAYASGQLAAMLIRSSVVAIAVGIALTIFGGMWGGLMSSWLAPAWWSVGSLPVIALFVTWLKANDWIEERRDRTARRRLWLGLGVPFAVLLTTCATYRVQQIPVVTLPAEWDEDSRVLARLTPAEKATFDIYYRATNEIEQGETKLESYADRSTRLKQEHADWTDLQVHSEAFEGFQRDWALQHVAAVPLLREAHRQPAVPLALVEAQLPARAGDDWDPERVAKLSWLMIRQAENSLKDGDLDATWDDLLIAFELVRRSDMRAIPINELFVGRMFASHEPWLLMTVAKWGRHKNQTRDRILMAIRKLDEIAADRTSIQHAVHHEFLQARELLKFDVAWQKHVARMGKYRGQWYEEPMFSPVVWKALFWERWRSDRVVCWQSSRALERSEFLSRVLKANRPLPLFSTTPYPKEYLSALATDLGLSEDQAKLISPGNYNHNSVEQTILDTTLVPANMQRGVYSLVDSEFLKRAESFRATILLLALSDYHREHGSYPESLSELAPTYFAEVPRNPKSAGPFVYFPHGVPEDVWTGSEKRGDLRVIVRKETPFLVTTYGRIQPDAQQMSDRSWKFTDYSGKPMTLEAALEASYIWLLEPDAPKREP